MILRSSFAFLFLALSLSFFVVLLSGEHGSEGPSVEDCQTHIDAAIEAFQKDGCLDTIHKGSLDLEEQDDEEHPQTTIADDNADDDEDDEIESTNKETELETEDNDDDDDAQEERETESKNKKESEAEDDDDENSEKQEVDDDDDDEEADNENVGAHTEDDEDDDEEVEKTEDSERESVKDDDEKQKSDVEDEDENDEEEQESGGDTDAKVEKRHAEEDDDDEEDEHQESEHPEKTKSAEDDEEETNEKDDNKVSEGDDDDAEDEKEESVKEGSEGATEHDDDESEDAESEKDEQQEAEKTEEEKDDDESEEGEEVAEKVEDSDSKGNGTDEGAADEDSPVEETDETEEEEEVLVAGPGELRSRDHIESILHVGEDEVDLNKEKDKAGGDILKELKKLYEGAVKPLEVLYKFKDISNRLLGDAEIFSKPMVVFLGPWSTGKSAIINYLLGTEYTKSALKTGAEPTSNTFNVILYGEQEQVIDGTQLAADWAFSSLQKFGQGFLDRLKGRKFNSPILRKLTIVDTPGIVENRKERLYPFNDAFQWFIDRADLIYIVFDPTKLDIGMEMEALFDQLKGRENQVRILLNKADTVKPQELMKVQGNILWNLSPVLGTMNAPTIFVGSFWSKPYLPGSPETLFDAQEEAFLEDLAEALDTRVENKVALARRHAVRVRNHAKMVDCYLNTYYSQKSFFSNKKQVASDIVENPQNYHIYEGMSTLTNVSRYDLPDPDIYKEFFNVNPLFDFKPLASTCSYFKGCPLDKLDITIAYDLPELVGKYHRVLSKRPPIAGGR